MIQAASQESAGQDVAFRLIQLWRRVLLVETGAVSWQVMLGHAWFLFGQTGADFAEMCHLYAASSLGNIDGP